MDERPALRRASLAVVGRPGGFDLYGQTTDGSTVALGCLGAEGTPGVGGDPMQAAAWGQAVERLAESNGYVLDC